MSNNKPSIKVDQSNPTFGSSITVTVDFGSHAKEDCGISLIVTQNGEEVMTVGGSPITDTHVGGTPYPFVLGPTAKWTGGSAQGMVKLYDASAHNKKVLASDGFDINA